jgi:hypothetical protein
MQAVAALAVAVVAMGEDTGSEMCTRIFGQLVRRLYIIEDYRTVFKYLINFREGMVNHL